MSEKSLAEQRKLASDQSLGLSNSDLYRAIEKFILPQGHVLDFGAGQGEFTKLLHQKPGFSSVTGIDLMKRPADLPSGIQWIQYDLNENWNSNSGTYDLLTAVEVIEHLENLRSVIRSWFEALKPGGQLVFSTPNNESWRALLSLIARGYFVAFGESSYPAHITPLLRVDLSRMLDEASFQNVQFHFTDRGCLPKLTQVTWQRISLGVLRGLRFSDNLIVTANKL